MKPELSLRQVLGLTSFEGFGYKLARLPYPLFAVASISLSLFHTGWRLPWRPDARFEALASGWPTGISWDSSPLWIMLPKIFGIVSDWRWDILWLTVAIGTFAVIAVQTRLLFPDSTQRHFLLTVLASGIPIILVGRIGLYDVPFIFGIVLTVLLRSRAWIFGPVIASGSNAELGLAAGVCALLVSFALPRDSMRVRSVVVVSLSVLVTVSTHVALMLQGVPSEESRLALLPKLALQSLAANVAWFPIVVATMYFGAWMVVASISLSHLQQRRVLLVSGLIVLPLLATLLTLDGTRVAVCASSMAFLIALRWWFATREVQQAFRRNPAVASISLTALVILVLITPAVSLFVPAPMEAFYPPWQSIYVVFWPW